MTPPYPPLLSFSDLQTHKLSEQEESEIRECFALFDRDKDGKIKVCLIFCVCVGIYRFGSKMNVSLNVIIMHLIILNMYLQLGASSRGSAWEPNERIHSCQTRKLVQHEVH